MAAPAVSLGDLAREGTAYLVERNISSARLDAEVLLAQAAGIRRSDLLPRLRDAAPVGVEGPYRALLSRRGERIPLQHITGIQEFWSLEFEVDSRVLIPRPETELIVEEALARNGSPAPLIADLGTGSGNIAVALARELPAARILATDVSEDALEVARRNAARHGVEDRIRFLIGSLADPLEAVTAPGSVDLLVSNPPYVSEEELAALEPEVRDHEPRVALTPGPDPLALYPGLLAAGARFLRPGGAMLLELPAGRSESAASLVRRVAELELLSVRSDYSGIPRILITRRR